MRLRLSLVLAVLSAPLAAQDMTSAEQAWNALARADVEAALELIERNHPGAAPELGDTRFQQALRDARANAQRRLPLVKTYGGHAALLSGLANEFRDGHIMSNALVAPGRRTWAGLVMTRSGGNWIVGAQDAAAGEPQLKGARLVSCDGVDADRFALERVGTFYAHPEIEAAMAARAPLLLLDDGNPFVAKAGRCRFMASSGATVEHELQWRPVTQRTWEKFSGEAYTPAKAGMGVTPFAGGQWIALETLGNEATRVVDQVRARQAELRAAPMVVLDLRGNSGGNSQYAVEIARALVGEARADAANRPAGECTGAYWRASTANAENLRKFARSLPADRAAEWTAQADALEAAVAQGRAFSPDLPACARKDAVASRSAPVRLPPSAMKGRLVLLTDRACFSSCLMAADLFRRLGALHVGEATDMSTRYMEITGITLPSGLRTFTTLQKVALGTGDFGPYSPAVIYPGPLSDHDKVKAWIAALPIRD